MITFELKLLKKTNFHFPSQQFLSKLISMMLRKQRRQVKLVKYFIHKIHDKMHVCDSLNIKNALLIRGGKGKANSNLLSKYFCCSCEML